MDRMNKEWNPKLISDREINNSNKKFAPPPGKIWKVVSVFVDLETTSTPTNRLVCVAAQRYNENENDIVSFCILPSVVEQEPSDRLKYYFGLNVDSSYGQQNNYGVIHINLPEIYLVRNTFLRVYDMNGVDQTGDDLAVELLVLEN